MFSKTAGNSGSYIHNFLQEQFNQPRELYNSKQAEEVNDFQLDDNIHDNKEQTPHVE